MIIRTPLLAAVAAMLLCTAAPAAQAAEHLPGAIEIPCAAGVLDQVADWYLPTGTPRALIWLQHGFARSSAQLADLATDFAEHGYLVFAPTLPFLDLSGCTLQNLGDNTGFLAHVADLFATAGDPAGALTISLAAAAARAGHETPSLPADLVFLGHSAGAEAVAFVADQLRTRSPGTWARLHGIVLFDPVKSFLGDNTDRALAGIDTTTLPALTISAPPSLCNNFGTGTDAVQTRLHRPFVGVRLPHGAHTDAEGTSSDLLGETLCGHPRSTDVTTLHTLALAWTADFLDGTTTPAYYPTTPGGPVPAAPTAITLSGS
ncbi:alpha/beta hydrolase [Nocardia sp. NPDC059177]|uniref:alpha/beta hydrolase n=1 Tax=Nocardia sp. NPDC059177 TaxID=3346759 RepID=UPI00368C8E36